CQQHGHWPQLTV
nr:immunoglobulin light chain junction region [Macaca mulatta]